MRRAAGGKRRPEPRRTDGPAAPKCVRAFRQGSAGSRRRAEEEPTGMSGEKGMASTEKEEEEEDSRERATIPKKGNEKAENIPLAGGKVKKSKR